MREIIDFLQANTMVYKLLIALIGVLIIFLIVGVLKKSLNRYVSDPITTGTEQERQQIYSDLF